MSLNMAAVHLKALSVSRFCFGEALSALLGNACLRLVGRTPKWSFVVGTYLEVQEVTRQHCVTTLFSYRLFIV
jgi:hypothetical protein